MVTEVEWRMAIMRALVDNLDGLGVNAASDAS